MRRDARRTVIAYDVPDDSRRARLARILLSYGDRIQYSVFVVDAAPVHLARLRASLEDAADLTQDSLLFCDLGLVSEQVDGRFNFSGLERPITDAGSFIV